MAKIQLTKDSTNLKFKFIAENEDESRILGTLRNHYFFGLDDTFPQYDGMESQGKYVQALKFKCKEF